MPLANIFDAAKALPNQQRAPALDWRGLERFAGFIYSIKFYV